MTDESNVVDFQFELVAAEIGFDGQQIGQYLIGQIDDVQEARIDLVAAEPIQFLDVLVLVAA